MDGERGRQNRGREGRELEAEREGCVMVVGGCMPLSREHPYVIAQPIDKPPAMRTLRLVLAQRFDLQKKTFSLSESS